MLFIKRLEFSCFADLFVSIFKTKEENSMEQKTLKSFVTLMSKENSISVHLLDPICIV